MACVFHCWVLKEFLSRRFFARFLSQLPLHPRAPMTTRLPLTGSFGIDIVAGTRIIRITGHCVRHWSIAFPSSTFTE
jgi:hypothetical protein